MVKFNCQDDLFSSFASSDSKFVKVTPFAVQVKKKSLYKPFDCMKRAKRGVITEMSDKSKRNFLFKLSSAKDFKPVFFITLTSDIKYNNVDFSNKFYKKLKDFKQKTFNKLYDTVHSEKCSFVWKREFQKNGTAHFHILCDDPLNRGLRWFQKTFVSSFGCLGVVYNSFSCTSVKIEPVRKELGCLFYFCKYSEKKGDKKSYQNYCPNGVHGRFWGFLDFQYNFDDMVYTGLTENESTFLYDAVSSLKSLFCKYEVAMPDNLFDSSVFFSTSSVNLKKLLESVLEFYYKMPFFYDCDSSSIRLETQKLFRKVFSSCFVEEKNKFFNFSLDKLDFYNYHSEYQYSDEIPF